MEKRPKLPTIMSTSAFQEVFDTNDDDIVADLIAETDKLRTKLTSRWINNERFIAFFDKDRDGRITYDEFYDGLSQFGLTEVVNADKVFAFVDKKDTGYVDLDELTQALQLSKNHTDQSKNDRGNEDHDEELPDFPETLLVALVAHNDPKVSFRFLTFILVVNYPPPHGLTELQ